MLDGHDLELWQGQRFVMTLKHKELVTRSARPFGLSPAWHFWGGPTISTRSACRKLSRGLQHFREEGARLIPPPSSERNGGNRWELQMGAQCYSQTRLG